MENIRVGFFDFVKEDHRIRFTAYLFCQLTAFLITDITRRCTRQTRHIEFFHILRHIKPDERVLIAKQKFGQNLCQLGFSHTGWAEKEKAPNRSFHIFQTRAGPADRLGKHFDGFFLPYHFTSQLLLHVQQAHAFLLFNSRKRNSGHTGNNIGNIIFGNAGLTGITAFIPVCLHRLQPIAQLFFLIAQLNSFFKFLIFDTGFFVANNNIYIALNFFHFWRLGDLTQTHPGPRLINYINSLIGEEPVADVSFRKPHSSNNRFIGDLDLVMQFIGNLKSFDNFNSLIHRRRIHNDGLKTPFQCAVFLNVFSVFFQSGRADALDLASGQSRFEHIGCIHRTFGGSRSHQSMQLVNEQNDAVILNDFLHDAFETSLKLTAILGARNQGTQIKRNHTFLKKRIRHFPFYNKLGQTFNDRGLTDTGFANQYRIIFRTATENLDHPLDFLGPTNDRVQLSVQGHFGQVTTELIQSRGLAHLAVALGRLFEHINNFFPDIVKEHAETVQNTAGDSFLLFQKTQEKMLGTNIIMIERPGLLHRKLQNFLGTGGKRNISDDQRV